MADLVGFSDGLWPLALQLAVFGLTNGAIIALNAAGFTLSYAVARQINLAHGNVFALTTVVVAVLAQAAGLSAASPAWTRVAALLALIVIGAAVGAALGLLVERLAFRAFANRGSRLSPLIASVAVSYVLLGAAVRWYAFTNVPGTGHQGVNLTMLAVPDLLPRLDLGGSLVSFTLKDAAVVLVALVVSIGLIRMLGRTATGRAIRAVAEDPQAAVLCGVDPRRAQTITFAVAGGLAGLGGAIFATYYGGTAAQQGLRAGLTAITAAILGGAGSASGGLLAGLALGLFSAFSDFFLHAQWTPILVLVLLVATLALRPRGLLGQDEAEQPASPWLSPPSANLPWLPALALVLAAAYGAVDLSLGLHRLPSATMAVLLVTLALGLSLVVVQAGLLDLGYAAFFAIGGYTVALLTGSGSRVAPLLFDLARDPWGALLTAGFVAALAGLIFGLPAIRARGEYLAIVTLALGELVPALIVQAPDITSGQRGINGVPFAPIAPWPMPREAHAFVAALALGALAWLLVHRLTASRTGRAWRATRDDETAASSLGVSTVAHKLLAFALGAAIAGVAGGLFAGLFGYVEPGQFDLTLSLMALSAVILGARYGPAGAIFGGLAIAAIDRVLIDVANGGFKWLGTAVGAPAVATLDLRGDSFLIFGIALYAALRLTSRAQPG
ncbi:MAG: hypothetical protein U0821_19215 [Chloroflexota bacterium]